MYDLTWTEECRLAFKKLKKFFASPPLLSKPEARELFLYLTTTMKVVSSVLIQMDDRKVQKLIYYTGKVLHDAETRYSKSKKIVFALIVSTQHLMSYFQVHPIVILIDQPLKPILHWPNTFG